MADEFPFRYVPPVDPNLGRRVDQYFILRTLLGRGGMGAAYLAEHEALAHIKCVIKLVLAELARHPMAISRYKTETEAVSRLKHDNIVKLQNFGVLEDGQLFMRFEYIEGRSLDRYVAERGGSLSLREAAYFVFQLCDALQYAHDVGVIHRDLKPDNLMVEISPPGSHLTERVKILDFGIAKVMASTTEHTGSGVSMGTPRFMAPEQVTNAAAATGRADVFSLAVIFYLIVTARLPWGTPESDIAIYHKQKTEAPARPTEDVMPTEVTDLLFRALSLVPDDRPTMREFAIELACAIPPQKGLPSGTEILKDVKRSWVASSLPHAQTLPRPVAADPTAAPSIPPRLVGPAPGGSMDVGLAGAPASSSTPPGSAQKELAASASVSTERGSADDQARAPALSAALGSPADTRPMRRGGPIDAPSLGLSTPVIAALPTGLVSQGFAAQDPPGVSRIAPIAVAAEIEMAAGTPGPQPYAHAELPPVLVSTTQLSGPAVPASTASVESRAHVEPPPVLVLPGASLTPSGSRSVRARVVLGGALLAVAAVAAFLLTRQRAGGEADHTSEAPAMNAAAAEPDRAVKVPVRPEQGSDGQVMHTELPGKEAPAPAASVAEHAQAASGANRPTTRAPQNSAVPQVPRAATAPRSAVPDVPRPSTPSAPSPSAPSVAKENGELAIIVRPWAAIWLNGKSIADGTPYRAQVPAGRYRIRIANEDLNQAESLTVTVEPHKTALVERSW